MVRSHEPTKVRQSRRATAGGRWLESVSAIIRESDSTTPTCCYIFVIIMRMSELPSAYNIVRTIRENQRYATFQAEYEGSSVFIKQVKADELADGVQRELWGLEAFAQLAETVELGFEVPRVIASGHDYLVTTWAEGEPIDFRAGTSNFDDEITFFATSLAKLDMATCLAQTIPAKFDMRAKDAKASVDMLRTRLKATSYTEFLNEALIDKGFKYLYEHIGRLAARLTHADFTPGNVLEVDGRRTLIDYESVSLLWPRFYDVVNLTCNRMIMDADLVPGCRKLMEQYFEANDAAEIGQALPQLNTIAMLRSLSLVWEHITEPNEYHNTQAVMTAELADRLAVQISSILAGRPYFEAL